MEAFITGHTIENNRQKKTMINMIITIFTCLNNFSSLVSALWYQTKIESSH